MTRSPLFAKWEAAQARLTVHHGWEIAASFSSVEAEYGTLQQGAGLLDLSHRGRILVRGKDAPRFLHGMVTNEVEGLEIGRGNAAFLLDVHGHILADARILRLEPESYLVDSEPQASEVISQALDRHIISDVVELEDLRSKLACLGLEGPGSRQALRLATGFDPSEMNFLQHCFREDLGARLVRGALSGAEGYWILASPDRAADLWPKLLAGGAKPVGFEALETCRIERGIPRYGVDITEKNLPQETGQMHALSFTKGCYIGQEVVERIRSRGHVNRKLVHLLFQGRQEAPAGTEVFFQGQPAGSTASSAYSFRLQRTIAFAYLRRESADAGNSVTVGKIPAEVADLPALVQPKLGEQVK